ncbi:MAG TPA: hypothetical protein VJY85_08950 [Candidatus Limnocylindria bacterium]|nr:hypothetical protein [Candidatus Limnocylindria bacterium]
MARAIALRAALAMTLVLATAGGVAARSDHQTSPVMWHPQTGLAGSVAASAQADLVRRPGGVSFRLQTEQLRPHHAYTVWFVVINNPSACAAHPCSGPDIILNSATDSQVTYGAGHISGASGRGSFAGSFRAGPIEGWLAGGGLWDPMTAEIQLVLNDHGPKLTDFMPGMISTYRSGCTEASIPAIFPPSARADGTPGPNACQLYQMAAFQP